MYEIHVTVHSEDKGYSSEAFREACVEIKVKPLTIELQGLDRIDYITSSEEEDLDTARIKLAEISSSLASKGFRIVRMKLERSPFEMEVNAALGNALYMESHINIDIPLSQHDKDCLLEIMSRQPLLYSRRDNCQIATLRRYGVNIAKFKEDVDHYYHLFYSVGFKVEQPRVEICIQDSNLNHDNLWIQNNYKIFNGKV